MLSQFIIANKTLTALLTNKAKLTVSTAMQVADLPVALEKKFTEFLNTSGFEKLDLNLQKYDIKEINELLTDLDLSETVQDLDNEELELELVAFTSQLVEHLSRTLPPAPSRFSPRPPSSFVISQYMRQFRTLNEPMTVVSDLMQGCLSRSQVETLSKFYPELLKVMQDSMIEAIIAKAAKDKDGIIPYAKLKLISVLMQQATTPEDLKQLLQSNFSQEKEGNKLPGGKMDSNQALTSSQKIEFK